MKYICVVQHMFNMCGEIGCVCSSPQIYKFMSVGTKIIDMGIRLKFSVISINHAALHLKDFGEIFNVIFVSYIFY